MSRHRTVGILHYISESRLRRIRGKFFGQVSSFLIWLRLQSAEARDQLAGRRNIGLQQTLARYAAGDGLSQLIESVPEIKKLSDRDRKRLRELLEEGASRQILDSVAKDMRLTMAILGADWECEVEAGDLSEAYDAVVRWLSPHGPRQ